MSFQQAVAFVLAQETGTVVHSTDGVSKWGVSQQSHPELTAEQIENMTPQQAQAIYGTYWTKIFGPQLPDYLHTPMMDSAVNQGPRIAIRCLQQALYVKVDGICGPATLRAANAASGRNSILSRFTAARISHYSLDKEWPTDGAGWAARAVLAALEAASSG
jgi:lysozyme family protein